MQRILWYDLVWDLCGLNGFRSFPSTSFCSPARTFLCAFSNLATVKWCGDVSMISRSLACCSRCLRAWCTWDAQRKLNENPLLEGEVDYLEDSEMPSNARVRRELIELYESCHTLIFGDYPKNVEDGTPENLSYLVAGALPVDLLWKQQILELRSEADRQERLVTYLREWAPHLQKTAVMRQRAGGNGHGLN